MDGVENDLNLIYIGEIINVNIWVVMKISPHSEIISVLEKIGKTTCNVKLNLMAVVVIPTHANSNTKELKEFYWRILFFQKNNDIAFTTRIIPTDRPSKIQWQ